MLKRQWSRSNHKPDGEGEALPIEQLETYCPENGMILANCSAIGMEPDVHLTPVSKRLPMNEMLRKELHHVFHWSYHWSWKGAIYVDHKPKMVVLGSREQLCIHPEVSIMHGKVQNNACQLLCQKRTKQYCPLSTCGRIYEKKLWSLPADATIGDEDIVAVMRLSHVSWRGNTTTCLQPWAGRFGVLLSLGLFSRPDLLDLAGAVYKISESVKKIEQNFDNAFGSTSNANGTLFGVYVTCIQTHGLLSLCPLWDQKMAVALLDLILLKNDYSAPSEKHESLSHPQEVSDAEIISTSDAHSPPVRAEKNAEFGYGGSSVDRFLSNYKFGRTLAIGLIGKISFAEDARRPSLLALGLFRRVHDNESLDEMVEPALRKKIPAKALSRFADIVSLYSGREDNQTTNIRNLGFSDKYD
ncbi:bifunctional 3-dehydroquinate dehydratase/shikimate dehydrogenase, chloroplastic-like protein [Tanacetum coccineum]